MPRRVLRHGRGDDTRASEDVLPISPTPIVDAFNMLSLYNGECGKER